MAYKQHFVECFSGKQLTDQLHCQLGGTSSIAMSDEVDGGLRMTSPNSTHGGIELNASPNNVLADQIRRFDLAKSTFFSVVKKTDILSTHWLGTGACFTQNVGTDAQNQYSIQWHESVSAYINGRSGDGSTTTTTASDIQMDKNWHGYKINSTGTVVNCSIDGVLKVAKTTNMPSGKGQQATRVGMNTAHSVGSTAQIRYMEIYND